MRRFAWGVFLSFDALLLASFLAAYAGAYVPTRYCWWLQLFAIGLPGLTVLVMLCMPAVVWRRCWWLLSLHVGFVLLFLVRIHPLGFRSPPPVDEQQAALNVMTFNAPDKWARGEQAGREMLALVHDVSPDLLCLQQALIRVAQASSELRPVRHLRVLFDSLRYTIVAPESPHRQRLTQPVLSPFELESQTETLLPLQPGAEDPSRVVRTEFRWQEQRAVVYNLHLRSFGDRKPWRDEKGCWYRPDCWQRYLQQYRAAFLIRAEEAKEIKQMLDQEALPLIVCGDFNSTPHNWVYRHLRQGLQDAFAIAGRGWGATYSSHIPFARIDYILVGPQWKVVSSHVAEARLSDHLPVTATLILKSEANDR